MRFQCLNTALEQLLTLFAAKGNADRHRDGSCNVDEGPLLVLAQDGAVGPRTDQQPSYLIPLAGPRLQWDPDWENTIGRGADLVLTRVWFELLAPILCGIRRDSPY